MASLRFVVFVSFKVQTKQKFTRTGIPTINYRGLTDPDWSRKTEWGGDVSASFGYVEGVTGTPFRSPSRAENTSLVMTRKMKYPSRTFCNQDRRTYLVSDFLLLCEDSLFVPSFFSFVRHHYARTLYWGSVKYPRFSCTSRNTFQNDDFLFFFFWKEKEKKDSFFYCLWVFLVYCFNLGFFSCYIR